jgi:hypothetical protein
MTFQQQQQLRNHFLSAAAAAAVSEPGRLRSRPCAAPWAWRMGWPCCPRFQQQQQQQLAHPTPTLPPSPHVQGGMPPATSAMDGGTTTFGGLRSLSEERDMDGMSATRQAARAGLRAAGCHVAWLASAR